MSNFEFLRQKPLFAEFAEACIDAEASLAVSYASAAMQTRRALELAVKWVYAYESELKVPYQDNLSALIHDHHFKGILPATLFPRLRLIVQLGNKAAHTARPVPREQAVEALHSLYEFVAWIDYSYADTIHDQPFDPALLPNKELNTQRSVQMQQELARMMAELEAKDKALQDLLKAQETREAFTQKREAHSQSREYTPEDISEYKTRKIYIDLMLEMAGWTLGSNCIEEVDVTGMPTPSGTGYVDYVLYAANGLPLAVVEAKRTSVDPKKGKIQAKAYADCLEAQHGVRPFIFYTNGFSTYFWDDAHAPDRTVAGFLTPAQCEWVRQREAEKQPLQTLDIQAQIVNRHYQKAAIQAVCEAFSQGHRRALLVMATGTGKTRTAIALVDLLMRRGWIKHVLFLADRRELIKQAKKNFANLLPSLSICNLLDAKDNPDSRMVFSTYPTMMNAIDTTRAKDGAVLFTPGHFDLIIVDEAHRSIYKKYQDIFSYFDGLLVGLTATPKTEIDHNTYALFELENNVPTYAYELADAVTEGYLVSYTSQETRLKFLEQGIVYDELSEQEKEEWEDTFDEGCEQIDSQALNEYLFNAQTIDTVLQDLMQDGIKIMGGDRLGKTIIFAANTKHADAILKRFNALYPMHAGKWAECIYNGIKYVDTVLDDFSTADKLPQIAISVDMLDTGIDIPELVNLVFFKKVRSKAKFWQMIGRGTRLRPDLFGIGDDKKAFRIFDYCGNFEFFRTAKNLSEGRATASLTEQLFGLRLRIAQALQHLRYQQPVWQAFRTQLIDALFAEFSAIDERHFASRLRIEFIHCYNTAEAWQNITDTMVSELEKQIAPLLNPSEDNELSKRFDALMYGIMLASLSGSSPSKQQRQKLVETGEALAAKGHLARIQRQAAVIERIQDPAYWQEADLFEHEAVRVALRDLLDLLGRASQQLYYTHFTDQKLEVRENPTFYGREDYRSYKAKVNAYLKDHANDLPIHKLHHNKALTPQDLRYFEQLLWQELGSADDYQREYGDEPLLKLVARLVGLERTAALELFSAFLSDHALNSQQIAFVHRVVDYVIENGALEKQQFNHPPFNDHGDLFTLFEGKITTVQSLVKKIDQFNARLQMG
ncbi:MAG: DEAD/DEAH box helicase family protein [Candidatus Sericytochromatia bacterium]|nr:DEAD/DEAH box helicase family protein [Candidatus Sericytochromatia bacterium]